VSFFIPLLCLFSAFLSFPLFLLVTKPLPLPSYDGSNRGISPFEALSDAERFFAHFLSRCNSVQFVLAKRTTGVSFPAVSGTVLFSSQFSSSVCFFCSVLLNLFFSFFHYSYFFFHLLLLGFIYIRYPLYTVLRLPDALSNV
jgi:hypothetical protein